MWWPFRRQNSDSYEKELVEIARQISIAQQRQLRYNIKLRRVKGFVTLYGVLLYAIYSALCFTGRLYRNPRHLAGLLGAPVVLYVVRYAVQSIFGYLIRANEESLKALQKRQEKNIEDLKERTNFYSTQALLERFDSPKPNLAHPPPRRRGTQNPASSDQKSPISTPTHTRNPSQLVLPEGASKEFTFSSPVPGNGMTPIRPGQTVQGPATGPSGQPLNGVAAIPPPPQLQTINQMPYQPKWYDRILDLIAGEDEFSPRARYALICQNCQNHNGLAPPGQLPEYTIYICPNCGAKNGKPPSKRKDIEKGEDEEDKHTGRNELQRQGKSEDSHFEAPSTPDRDAEEEEEEEGENSNSDTDPTGTALLKDSSTVKKSLRQRKRVKPSASNANLTSKNNA